MAEFDGAHGAPYSRSARRLHWLTAFLIAIQVPIGLYMTYRGYELEYVTGDGVIKKGLFDATTGFLYDSHKLLGLFILVVVVVRLGYRLTAGAPAHEPSMPKPLIGISHAVHWSIYVLLIAVPIAGYLGVSYYGAHTPFGLPIPSLVPKDQPTSKVVFEWHAIGAFTLLALIAVHIAAAFYHRFIRRDGVLSRMWPGRLK